MCIHSGYLLNYGATLKYRLTYLLTYLHTTDIQTTYTNKKHIIHSFVMCLKAIIVYIKEYILINSIWKQLYIYKRSNIFECDKTHWGL